MSVLSRVACTFNLCRSMFVGVGLYTAGAGWERVVVQEICLS